MQSQPQAKGDLSVLSRTAPARATGQGVPRPGVRWKTRVLLPVVLLAALGGLGAWSLRDVLFPATEVRVVPVLLKDAGAYASVQAAAGTVVAQAAGWVEADPYPTYVSALADGIVEQVLVLEGHPVKENQVVARLVAADADLAHRRALADVQAKQAALQLARATAAAARRDWDNPVQRERAVAVAEATLAEADAELARLPSQIRAEQARARELKDELDRMVASVAKDTATEFELNQAKYRHEAQVETLAATQQREPVLQAKVRRLKAELAAARKDLALRIPEKRVLDESAAAVDEAKADLRRAEVTRDEAKLRLDRMEVTSPFAGLVSRRLKSPGDKIMVGMDNPNSSHVVSLYDPAKLQVRVDVPLVDAAKVFVGQRAKIVVDVLPDRTFTGTVTRIVREADIQKNTQQVKVAIDRPSRHLAPEMLARAKFLAGKRPGSGATTQPTSRQAGNGAKMLLVPGKLLTVDKDRPDRGAVWIVDSRTRTAVRAEVRLGPRRVGPPGRQWVEIVEGVRPGDRVIAADPAAISDGQRVGVVGEADDLEG